MEIPQRGHLFIFNMWSLKLHKLQLDPCGDPNLELLIVIDICAYVTVEVHSL